jgi:predicted transcriptional regulator
MSTLSIRLSDDLDARLSEESRLASQPKSLLARTALEQFLAGRRHERFLARLAVAAAATEPDAAVLAAEALPFDNEALALAEGRDPAAEWSASGGES